MSPRPESAKVPHLEIINVLDNFHGRAALLHQRMIVNHIFPVMSLQSPTVVSVGLLQRKGGNVEFFIVIGIIMTQSIGFSPRPISVISG